MNNSDHKTCIDCKTILDTQYTFKRCVSCTKIYNSKRSQPTKDRKILHEKQKKDGSPFRICTECGYNILIFEFDDHPTQRGISTRCLKCREKRKERAKRPSQVAWSLKFEQSEDRKRAKREYRRCNPEKNKFYCAMWRHRKLSEDPISFWAWDAERQKNIVKKILTSTQNIGTNIKNRHKENGLYTKIVHFAEAMSLIFRKRSL